MSPTRLIMHGAAGRMGRRILSLAAEDANGFSIIAGVDINPGKLRELGVPSDAPLQKALPVAPGAVVIDFSHPDVTPGVVRHCAEHGMPLVIGTTGIKPESLNTLIASAVKSIPILAAPNMSLGVNLVIAMAAKMSAALGEDYDIEIVEAHHNKKLDAPSGTALGIADAIAAATDRTRADYVNGRDGQVGARTKREIGIHAVRMGDVVGDHTVYWVGGGERIMLGHMAHTRDIFAKGALRAAAFLGSAKPGNYGMADVLGLR